MPTDNRRIAKNTIYLYIRQIVTMCVSLYTYRIVLKLLGVDDYGTYNVVGGVVVLFSFLSGAMTTSTQRYLSYHLGKNDEPALIRVFSMSVNIYLLLCLVILLMSETVGLWFVNTYLKFPHAVDMTAVNIVYQCTIATLMIGIMQSPYQSAIIAYERMNFFAYMSIFDVIAKLLVVCVLFIFDSNRLVAYALTLSLISGIVCLVYANYTTRKFKACRYKRIWNRKLFLELTSFGSWNLLGSASNVAAQQGLNILMNLFVGVAVNAAMGICNQVCGAVNSFVTNFQKAFNPQIIKLYASDEKEEFLNLVFRSSRMSFMLLFIMAMPIIVCCEPLLNIWLTVIPPYTLQFTRLMLVFSMIDALSGPLWISAQASGRIKGYMILMSGMIFMNIPLAYLVLRHGLSPVYAIIIRVVLNFIIANVRIFYLNFIISFPVGRYYKEVMIPVIFAAGLVSPLPLCVGNAPLSLIQTGLLFVLTFLISAVVSLFLLLKPGERSFLVCKIKKILILKKFN